VKRPAIRLPIRRGALAIPMALLAAAAATVFVVANEPSGINHAAAADRPSTRGEQEDLAAMRAATDPFHDVEAAKAAGYPGDATGCKAYPDGYFGFPPGNMGHHWVNPTLVRDGAKLEVTKPEALLYETQADGSLELVAVEYIIPEVDLPRTSPPPVFFGRQVMFHEDVAAWTLHVWVWRDNPYGTFADVSPRVSCEHAG
jgi:hypothetical protein